MPSLKTRVANCFGRHSRRVWRCIVGATWSLPLRYVTFAAQLAAMSAVPGVSLQLPPAAWALALSAGVLVGWALRVADNLVNEYWVFEFVKRFFTSTPKDHRP